MKALDVITKKRDNLELSHEEIGYMVKGITTGEIPDYQMAAFLMAVFFRGLSLRETLDLTLEMAASGGPLPRDLPFFMDKHSTGGVGDKTTLVLAPLVASCGVKVGKMSGRGLGHTGGTIDKLEAIPGFRTELGRREFLDCLEKTGVCLAAQTPDMAPADKRMYSLRDVTGTVESIPLIVSSVVSKKISTGARGVVFDVKVGDGAFVQDVDEALCLARSLVDVCHEANLKAEAVLTSMRQPLGRAVGNALEVREALNCLAGAGPEDLEEVCLDLGRRMLVLAGWQADEAQARLEESLMRGDALKVFERMVVTQSGDPGVMEGAVLPKAPHRRVLVSRDSGYLGSLNARLVGEAARALGAGRQVAADPIDPAVGIVLLKKVADPIEVGEPLAEVHHRDGRRLEECIDLLERAFDMRPEPVVGPPLFLASVANKSAGLGHI